MKLSNQNFGFIGILLFVACRIPRDAVVFSNGDLRANKKIEPIPVEWDTRYLAVGNAYQIGGDLVHRHAIPHTHEAFSKITEQHVNPLGLSYIAASADHVHRIYSYFQNGNYSGYAPYQLHTAELQASVTKRGFNHVPNNMILLYIGKTLPRGWIWCDGTNNTPDLRGAYIRIRIKDAAPSAYGENTHTHSTKHSHKWGVDPPDPSSNVNKALAKDTWTYETDTIRLSLFSHIHGVQETLQMDTLTQAEEIVPLSLALNFIQATGKAKKIPKDALLAFVGTENPFAWKRWHISAEQEGSLVSGSSAAHTVTSWFGKAAHRHKFVHSHIVQLTSFPRAVISVSSNEAPSVAMASHIHEVQADLTLVTDSAASFPSYVRFTMLLKK